MDRLPLSDLLDGNLPPTDKPLHRLEKPCYKRDGLYGATPFKPKEVTIVAVTTEQVCKHCGASHLGFGGVFYEFLGQGLNGPLMMRNVARGITKDKIEKVAHVTEQVPYCPTCLGKGDEASKDTRSGMGESEMDSLDPAPY